MSETPGFLERNKKKIAALVLGVLLAVASVLLFDLPIDKAVMAPFDKAAAKALCNDILDGDTTPEQPAPAPTTSGDTVPLPPKPEPAVAG